MVAQRNVPDRGLAAGESLAIGTSRSGPLAAARGARAADDPRRRRREPDPRVPDVTQERRAAAAGYRTSSSVPLLLPDGRPIGAIGVRAAEVRPFTDRQIALLETFADQAVIAIENVRLFNSRRTAT